MILSDGEKLILMMLTDLYKRLGVDGDVDADFVSEAITSGNSWALNNKYSGIFHGEEAGDEVVSHVHDVLSTWSIIERSVAGLTPAERTRLETEAAPFGKNPRFPGFDGNNESDHMSAMRFMVQKLGYHPDFADRAGLNSHMPTIETFQRMKPKFDKSINDNGFSGELNVEQLIAILNEKRHPSNR